MIKQLALVRGEGRATGTGDLADLKSLPRGSADFNECLRKVARGFVSYVDGTKDRKNFPMDGGWRVMTCDMPLPQMHNFSSRCHLSP